MPYLLEVWRDKLLVMRIVSEQLPHGSCVVRQDEVDSDCSFHRGVHQTGRIIHARAVIAGLGMDLESLVALYVAGLCGIGYGLRQIIYTQKASGAVAERVVICGGAGSDTLVRQILADASRSPSLPFLRKSRFCSIMRSSAALRAARFLTCGMPWMRFRAWQMNICPSRLNSRRATTGGTRRSGR